MSAQDMIATGYAALLEEVEPLLFMARSKSLQMCAVTTAENFLKLVEQARLQAMFDQCEEIANDFLGLSMVIRALISELHVYILLKNEDAEAAWIKLIDAQGEITMAARASRSITNLDKKFDFLRGLEKSLFPPQSFMSAGFIVRRQDCSICQDNYEKCDHVAGLPYMGRFCSVVLKDVSADHVALVDAPADRRCRVTSFSVPGGTRNKMTWVITPKIAENSGNMEAIIAVA
jgi:hypothetical protein